MVIIRHILITVQQIQQEVFWYEDPSTVSAPTISFSGVTTPPSSSTVVAYSSGIRTLY